MDLNRFEALPLMGILRGIKAAEVAPVVETAVKAGLSTIEITMNTPDAPALIQKMISLSDGRLWVGAGTVLDRGDLDQALEAGARFVVTPTLQLDVVARCVALGVPVFPGALTPKEIHDAWRAGAAMVKVFPSSAFGPSYFREVAGPFPEIPLMACGGVTVDTVRDYFDCGARAASFGGDVFKRAWIENGDFPLIEERLRALIAAVPRRA